MNPQLSPDEAHLDRLWREAFGQPLPLIGAPDIARRILRQHGVALDTPAHSAHPVSRGSGKANPR